AGEDLIVAARAHAQLARGEELASCLLEARLRGRRADPQLVRDFGERHGDAQVPRRVLEVRWSVKPPVPARDGPLLGSERRLELVARPDVELAFLVLAVSVHTGVERALG